MDNTNKALSRCLFQSFSEKPPPRYQVSFTDAEGSIIQSVITVGFETNLERSSQRKEIKCRPLIKHFENTYRKVKFINLSTSSLGIFGQTSESFFVMCKELGIEKPHLNYITMKMTIIIIRTTYYIFCMRNKPWTDPELLSY